MDKKQKILYLKKIHTYFNLTALCALYNSIESEKIDYNNLRLMINEKSSTRVKEAKIDKFIDFIQNHFALTILGLKSNNLYEDRLQKKCDDLTNNINELKTLIQERNKYEI